MNTQTNRRRPEVQRCPYCKGDQSEMFAIMTEEAPPSDTLVGLCTECGELIVYSGKRFRRPTPDEHVEMQSQDRIRVARAAWLLSERLKRNNEGLPLRRAWGMFFEKGIADARIGLQSFEKNSQLWDAFRDCFYAGSAHMLAAVRQAYDEADSYEEFEGRMLLLNTEVNAYGESRTGKRNGQ